MTPRPRPRKSRIDIPAAALAFTIANAGLAGLTAYFTFNSKTTADIAVLQQQVSDLRQNQRDVLDRLRDLERDRRGAGE